MIPFTIKWITPLSPSCQKMYLLDTMHFRAGLEVEKCLETQICAEDFKVDLWTNIYHKNNNEGEWHAVPMCYEDAKADMDNMTVNFLYGVDLILTCEGQFDFTFRARHKYDQNPLWAKDFKIDGHVQVLLPVKEYTTWVQEPLVAQITHNIYIGNYRAALEAPESGFDGLLNLSEEAQVFAQQFISPIIFKQYPMPFGANNIISDEIIRDTVKWLRAMSNRCRKVLVCCRMGHGRSGSVLVAFIFAMNPNLTFEEAYKFVNDRHFIYYHRGLKNCLYRLYPRD